MPYPIANFDARAEVYVDDAGEIYLDSVRVTRAGGWVRIASERSSIPRLLQRIAVHLVTRRLEDGSTLIGIDRVRVADVVWEDVDSFLEVFNGAWAPDLREATVRAITPEDS